MTGSNSSSLLPSSSSHEDENENSNVDHRTSPANNDVGVEHQSMDEQHLTADIENIGGSVNNEVESKGTPSENDEIDDENYCAYTNDDEISQSDTDVHYNDGDENIDHYLNTDDDSDTLETVKDDYSIDEGDNLFDDSKIMFEASKLTVNDVMTLVMAFSIRFKLSDVARTELMNLIKLLSGPLCSHINISKYRFQKKFNPPDKKVTYHYYCTNCKQKILYSDSKENFVKRKEICTCNTVSELTLKSKNYFMSIDLKYQLEMMFNSDVKKEIFKFLYTMHNKTSEKNNTITDIYDSELYKNINNSSREHKYVTYNISTDGAPLTKSGRRGFWPMQIIPNYLPPSSRNKYPLLCGILTCTEEISSDLANLYFTKFNEQAVFLYDTGIQVTDLDNQKVIIKFCPLAISVDSVARPILQNRIQFNGYFGCSWCYHPGQYVKEVSGIRYGLLEIDPETRSQNSHLADVTTINSKLSNLNSRVKSTNERGVKGDICISSIPRIDMVWSFVYDYMHGILAGVDQHIFKQWTDPKSKCSFKLSSKDFKIINSRLLLIKPTQDIHRQPRSLKEKGNWKCAEIKSWLLIYSLPCLQGILNDTALNHYSLLVKSLYTLLKNNITTDELQQCKRDLLEFVGNYEVHYGIENMTYNIHTLLHVVESVKKCGPLWSNYTFPFEGNIFQLKQLVNGPSGMDIQITRKHLQRMHFKTGNVTYSSNEIKNFCSDLYTYRSLSTHFHVGDDDVVFVGKKLFKKINEVNCKVYKKCVYKGKVFHSINYSNVTRTNDTVVQLNSNNYGQIVNILSIENECHLELSRITTYAENIFNVPHIEKIWSEDFENPERVPITQVKRKIILVNIGTARYLCHLPNDFEVQ